MAVTSSFDTRGAEATGLARGVCMPEADKWGAGTHD